MSSGDIICYRKGNVLQYCMLKNGIIDYRERLYIIDY